MKSICFIAPKAYQIFNPKIKSTFGGAEVQLYSLAKEISKNKNFDVNFMVADYGQKCMEEYEDVKVFKSLNFKENIIKQIIVFDRVFKKINANVCFQRTLSPFSGIMALYCKIKNKKFIYMVAHDSEADNGHFVYKKFITKFLANLTFKFADTIIVQNKYQKNKLKNFKSVDTILVKSSYQINRINNKNGEYTLWVARSMSWKRPDLFLKLAKQFPKEKFLMICPPATGNKQLSEEIKKKSQSISNLTFIKFVPFDEIDEYFLKAKVFINTSEQEGFPNTFIQAAKNKTPILSLNVNPDNFLKEYNCGIYCKGDFDLLKSSLNKLLGDDALCYDMSKNAYDYAKKITISK